MNKEYAALLAFIGLLTSGILCEADKLSLPAFAIIGGTLAIGMLLLTKEKSR